MINISNISFSKLNIFFENVEMDQLRMLQVCSYLLFDILKLKMITLSRTHAHAHTHTNKQTNQTKYPLPTNSLTIKQITNLINSFSFFLFPRTDVVENAPLFTWDDDIFVAVPTLLR